VFTPDVWKDPNLNQTRRAWPDARPARVMAGNIRVGDLIVSYMKGGDSFVRVDEVLEAGSATDRPPRPLTTRSPVRYDPSYKLAGEMYPLYVSTKPLVVYEKGVSIDDIRSQLSNFRNLRNPKHWGRLVSSAQHWDYTDGEIVLHALQEAARRK
jgi:hypothetical protein